jgi:hypothetical protein
MTQSDPQRKLTNVCYRAGHGWLKTADRTAQYRPPNYGHVLRIDVKRFYEMIESILLGQLAVQIDDSSAGVALSHSPLTRQVLK